MPSIRYTQVIPIVDCSDKEQLLGIMDKCGVARALTYNKFGSLKGWGLHWTQADPTVRKIIHPDSLGLPSKIFEWSVNDCMKAITAQQEAAVEAVKRKIYRLIKDKTEQKNLLKLLKKDPLSSPWLHRHFRKEYQRGHTYLRGQVVYQKAGYRCKRLSRHTIKVEVAGLIKGKRITLIVKSQRLLNSQIRVINNNGQLEIHSSFTRELPEPQQATKTLGLDKGYTEGFYTSNGDTIASGLGKLLTDKSDRITKKNRNRARLFAHAKLHKDKTTAERIKQCNLGRKVENKKLAQDKTRIKQLIREGLRQHITEPTELFVEDLSSPIKSKNDSKRINRKLNSWVKGELQDSVEVIVQETGSTVVTVNPAYTSQVDCLTGTLLGRRDGDRFTCYTGVVLQADKNAAKNILTRGTDSEISRYMKYSEVLTVLLHRTVRYLHSQGYSVEFALTNGWLQPKFKKQALVIESSYLPLG